MSNIAMVADAHSVWDRSVCELPCYTVGARRPKHGIAATISKSAVAVSADLANPQNATSLATCGLFPKPFSGRPWFVSALTHPHILPTERS